MKIYPIIGKRGIPYTRPNDIASTSMNSNLYIQIDDSVYHYIGPSKLYLMRM